jgi:NAD(P) transhydrogenase subunit alpha
VPVKIAVPKEITPHENRVALVPGVLSKLQHCQVCIEENAGKNANYLDEAYVGAEIMNAAALYDNANMVIKVQAPTVAEIDAYSPNTCLIGMLAPYKNLEIIKRLAEKKITSFSLELIPRITRAQAMDVLSSQAAAAGYKAVILAAHQIGRFFPMLTTAAGTIRPVTVLIIGAGVAGLQAIATARRLGAIVEAYDIRPEAREQIESLGAKMVDLNINARGEGGYARELTEEEKQQQHAILTSHVAKAEIIISTAAIPGRPAPKIITTDMVNAMKPGSVIIDIAAESGGNCELTKPGETINHHGVDIVGALNLPSTVARDSSDMYSRNVIQFLSLLVNADGELAPAWEDEIITACMITHQGNITHPATRAKIEEN